jgi:hypothetical protein
MTTSAQLMSDLTGVVATLLMVIGGINMKQLRRRTVRCPVCRHTPPSCTCRLL